MRVHEERDRSRARTMRASKAVNEHVVPIGSGGVDPFEYGREELASPLA